MNRITLALACASLLAAEPALAAGKTADGVTIITDRDAIAGNVTPGDAPGYPVTLSVPGSYRLGSDLVPRGTNINGIVANAPEIKVDFNGFTITGGTTALNGVVGNFRGLTVTGGTIRGFFEDGIKAKAPQLMVDNMRLADNGQYGIDELFINASPKTGMEDGHLIVRNSILMHNYQGITCQSGCLIQGNVISFHTYSAIIIGQSGSLVIDNMISNNGGYGVTGNYVGLSNNTLFNNGYCHTSGVMLVGTRNMIYPESSGTFCTALPGN